MLTNLLDIFFLFSFAGGEEGMGDITDPGWVERKEWSKVQRQVAFSSPVLFFIPIFPTDLVSKLGIMLPV